MKFRAKLLITEQLNRLNYNKQNLKYKLLKSIRKCQNKPSLNNLFINTLLINQNKKDLQTRHQNRCKITGRLKGFVKQWNLSRHMVKRQATYGYLHNTKIKSW